MSFAWRAAQGFFFSRRQTRRNYNAQSSNISVPIPHHLQPPSTLSCRSVVSSLVLRRLAFTRLIWRTILYKNHGWITLPFFRFEFALVLSYPPLPYSLSNVNFSVRTVCLAQNALDQAFMDGGFVVRFAFSYSNFFFSLHWLHFPLSFVSCCCGVWYGVEDCLRR